MNKNILIIFPLLVVLAGCESAPTANPNAGKPTAGKHGLSEKEAKTVGVEGYEKVLKQNRPDLSDAQIHKMAVDTISKRDGVPASP